MSSSSGSARSSQDIHEELYLQILEGNDFDSASETSEVKSYHAPKSQHFLPSISRFWRNSHNLASLLAASSSPAVQRDIEKGQTITHDRKLHPTAYLDGMRGLAAFAVFLCHLSYGSFDLTHTYFAGDQDSTNENTSLLQLPGIRLIYSGPPMVAIFFVISGYVLSYKPLKQMRGHDYGALVLSLTSTVFRRALRLFLPCLVSTLIVVCLVQFGAYELTEDFATNMRMINEDHVHKATSFGAQLVDWSQQMLDFANVFDWSLYSGSTEYDRHLWTIPVEFRCSLALFITHLLVGRMRSAVRLLTLSFLLVWGTYWNRWEMVPFWAGALIAELELIKTEEGSIRTEHDSRDSEGLASILNTAIFMIGLYLASYPDADGHVSPGYVSLTNMIPERYTEKHRFWPTIGAIIIVWSVGELKFLRKTVFESCIMQYLGRLSFPLYVCHGFVIHTFGYMIMDRTWLWNGGYDDWQRFQLGFAFSAFCIVGVTIWISHVFLHVVDSRCVRFAKWLEEQLFIP